MQVPRVHTMPYLVQIGAIRRNKTGIGSRGYHVYRRGIRVRVVWGPVRTVRGRTVKFVWERTTMHKDYRCSSERAAIARLKDIVAARRSEGYSLLPVGARILRRAESTFSTRRSSLLVPRGLTRACSRQAGWAYGPLGRHAPRGRSKEALICAGGRLIACS